MSYAVVRYYFKPELEPARGIKHGDTVRRNLTLAEAQEHCLDERTHGGPYCPHHGLVKELNTPMDEFPYCPKCGTGTHPAWFDGYTATANLK